MKKITGLLICILLMQHFSAKAQSFAINIDGTPADASALLDVKSTNKGLLMPRMTLIQKNAILLPATGLLVYQTDGTIGLYENNGTPAVPNWQLVLSSSNAWSLTGNTGTNPANNFIGTIDNQPLRFRSNNIWSGEINTATNSVSLGWNSLSNNTGGTNTAMGSQSMRYNSGSYNSALGSTSLYNNSGSYNTALGYYALSLNISGYNNAATGVNAMQKNTFGYYNAANGPFSLSENTTGNYNTAMGGLALITNKYGSNNTAIGAYADVRDSSYSNATAIGARSAVNCNNCLVLGSVNGINGATSNVNVGIGTTNPIVPLNFSTALGDKIALWSNGTTHYGFGIQPSLLQVYTEYNGADIAFGYGNSAAFTENVRFRGNGFVGIGVYPVAKLQISGSETSTHGLAAAIQLRNTASANSWTLRAGATGTATPVDGFSIGDNTAYRLVINSAGNVGINTPTPAAMLDVAGNAAVSTNLTVQSGMGIIRNISGIQLKKLSTAVPVNVSLPPSMYSTFTVTWPQIFSVGSIEAYVGNVISGSFFNEVIMSVTSVTTTGAVLHVYNPTSSQWPLNYTVNVIAIGPQ